MAGGGDAVGGAPILDTLGEPDRVQLGSEAEQVVPGGLRVRADVVPQGRIIGARIEAVPGHELLVELVRPGPATRAIQRGLVEERRVDRRAEMAWRIGRSRPVSDFDEPVGGLGIQVIADRIAVDHAHKRHEFPLAGGGRPVELPLAHRVGQFHTLQSRAVHGDHAQPACRAAVSSGNGVGPVISHSCLSSRLIVRSGHRCAKRLVSLEFWEPAEPLGKPYSS